MTMFIRRRLQGRFVCFEGGGGSSLFVIPYVHVAWAITRVRVMTSSLYSRIPFCCIANSCGEISMYVVYVVCVLYVLCLVWGDKFISLLNIVVFCSKVALAATNTEYR
jgi:hypothetical protein